MRFGVSLAKRFRLSLRALSKDVGHKIRIIKIDIDKNKDLAHKYKIRSVYVVKQKRTKLNQN